MGRLADDGEAELLSLSSSTEQFYFKLKSLLSLKC